MFINIFLFVYREFFKTLLGKRAMANKDIVSYLKEGKGRGFSLGELKQKLLEADFNDEEIDDAINSLVAKERTTDRGIKEIVEKESKAEKRSVKKKSKKGKAVKKKAKRVRAVKKKPVKKKVIKEVKRVVKKSKKVKTVKGKVKARKVGKKPQKKKLSRRKLVKKVVKIVKPVAKIHKKHRKHYEKHLEIKYNLDKEVNNLRREIRVAMKEKAKLKKQIVRASSGIVYDRQMEKNLKMRMAVLVERENMLVKKKKIWISKVGSINSKLNKIIMAKSQIGDIS